MKPTKQTNHFAFFFFVLLISINTSSAQVSKDSLFAEGMEDLDAYRFGDALENFFECQRVDPFNIEYLTKVGYCYYNLGNLQEARTYFLEVTKNDSTNLSALNYLATIEEQMLDYRSALNRMTTLTELDTANSFYYRSAGNLSERLGALEDAVTYYKKALSLNPNDQSALISLCDLYARSNYLDYADSLLNNALNNQPKNLRLLYASASVNYRLRAYEEVLPSFETALELGDTSLRYLPVYAYSLAQLDQCDQAIPWMEYLEAKIAPEEQLHYFLGFCIWKSEEDAEKSMEHYERAVELGLSPNLGVYFQRMGDIMAAKNRHRSALKNYEQAQKYGNEDPAIHFHMAVAFDHVYKKEKKRPLKSYQLYLKKYDGKNPEFKAYAQKRVDEIEYYENEIWKGN